MKAKIAWQFFRRHSENFFSDLRRYRLENQADVCSFHISFLVAQVLACSSSTLSMQVQLRAQ